MFRVECCIAQFYYALAHKTDPLMLDKRGADLVPHWMRYLSEANLQLTQAAHLIFTEKFKGDKRLNRRGSAQNQGGGGGGGGGGHGGGGGGGGKGGGSNAWQGGDNGTWGKTGGDSHRGSGQDGKLSHYVAPGSSGTNGRGWSNNSYGNNGGASPEAWAPTGVPQGFRKTGNPKAGRPPEACENHFRARYRIGEKIECQYLGSGKFANCRNLHIEDMKLLKFNRSQCSGCVYPRGKYATAIMAAMAEDKEIPL